MALMLHSFVLSTPASYAADPDYFEIRGMSSRRNEQLFDKIAIDLLNGKSRFVSLDNMVKILHEFEVVEFHSKDIEPAKDIILKEVAFRMLKSHYLPRAGDKIRVYRLQKEFQADDGTHPKGGGGFETTIRLPLEAAKIKDRSNLAAIHYSSMVAQISTAIERLWLKRIGHTSFQGGLDDEKAILNATVLLRRKFIQEENIDGILTKYPAISDVVQAASEMLEGWLCKGVIIKKDLPAITEISIQYIVLSNPVDISAVVESLKGMDDVNDLLEALLHRIKGASESIKNYDPADYGAFAMLQSLLNEISDYSSRHTATTTDRPINIDFRESHHSA